jgi:hypothetical protein
MWATLALSAALGLAPAQAGQLELKNVRATYGILGPERADTQLLPGDVFIVAFDIEGLKVSDQGKVLYSMGMKLTRKGKDKPEFEKAPQDLEVVNTLGGTRLPSFAQAVIGTDTEPGEYTMDVTVKDRAANKTQALSRKFEVVANKLGFVRLQFSYENGLQAPPMAVAGQTLLLNFAVVGFGLDKTKQQPNLAVDMTILDESGKPTLEKPFSGAATEVTEEFRKIIPMQFILHMNRSGKFKCVLKATDKHTGKTVEQPIDLTIVEPK